MFAAGRSLTENKFLRSKPTQPLRWYSDLPAKITYERPTKKSVYKNAMKRKSILLYSLQFNECRCVQVLFRPPYLFTTLTKNSWPDCGLMINPLVFSCCYGNQRLANEATDWHLLHSASKTFQTVYHRKFCRLSIILRQEIGEVSFAEFVPAIFQFISEEGQVFVKNLSPESSFRDRQTFAHVACLFQAVLCFRILRLIKLCNLDVNSRF